MPQIIVVGYDEYDFVSSLIVGEIEFLDCELDLEKFDSLIFTSKNAIRALDYNAQRYLHMNLWRQMPSFVIGAGSKKVLEDLGGSFASMPSDFHGYSMIEALIPLLQNRSPLYLRAEHIVSNLDKELLQKHIALCSEVIYRNRLNHSLSSQQKPKQGSILLFTAPSAYRFFCQLFEWDESYVAFALGKTTFNSFDSGIQKLISPFQEIRKTVLYLKSQYGLE